MKTLVIAVALSLASSAATAEFFSSLAVTGAGVTPPATGNTGGAGTPAVPAPPTATTGGSGSGDGLLLMLLVVGAILVFNGGIDRTRNKAAGDDTQDGDGLLMRF